MFFKKRAIVGLFLIYISSFRAIFMQKSIVDFGEFRTRIIGLGDKRADHLTTKFFIVKLRRNLSTNFCMAK